MMPSRIKAYGCIVMVFLAIFSLIIIPFGLLYGANELHVPAIGLSVFWGLVILISLVKMLTQAGAPKEAEPGQWKCPNCGIILQKRMGDETADIFLSTAVGTVTCGECGSGFSPQDVYGGKYDI